MNLLIAKIREYWLPITLSILTAITSLSLYPVEQLPAVPGSDKMHHYVAYGALIFPVTLQKPKYWLLMVLLFVSWSGAIELIQPYVNRYGEWLDLAANCLGLFSGILLGTLCNYLFPMRLIENK